MSAGVRRPVRADYPRFLSIQTRWNDNDVYGHVNNVVYFEFFDTAINSNLIACGLLDVHRSPAVALVVDNRCTYFSPVSFPDLVHAGIKVRRMGTSSITYEVGIFRNDDDLAAATGTFVHVYVDRQSRQSIPVPAPVREALSGLMAA